MTIQTFTDDHYNTLYADQTNGLYTYARKAAYGEEWGQAGWSNLAEIDRLLGWLPLNADTDLLDFGCGAGGVSLRAAVQSGCRVEGIDISEQGIANAQRLAKSLNLADRSHFRVVDVAAPSTLQPASYDVIICLDAITDMPERERLLSEWQRVLVPGGVALYIDCLVLAGQITNEELHTRSGTGYNVYTPLGVNERMIADAGFDGVRREDLSEGLIAVCEGWVDARQQHAARFIEVEGKLRFEQDQTFHRLAARLARERRLLRQAFIIRKRQGLSNQ